MVLADSVFLARSSVIRSSSKNTFCKISVWLQTSAFGTKFSWMLLSISAISVDLLELRNSRTKEHYKQLRKVKMINNSLNLANDRSQNSLPKSCQVKEWGLLQIKIK